jgi:hypothetical protein
MRFTLTTAQLRQKIMQVETAIIHCSESSLFNLQSVFARTLQVDNHGIIWLLPEQAPDCSPVHPSSFEVILNYHKKGLQFDLDVLGKASILTGKEAPKILMALGQKPYDSESILLRVQVTDIDYWEQKPMVLKDIVMTRFPRSATAEPAEPFVPAGPSPLV